jgi:hypothetical protein
MDGYEFAGSYMVPAYILAPYVYPSYSPTPSYSIGFVSTGEENVICITSSSTTYFLLPSFVISVKAIIF